MTVDEAAVFLGVSRQTAWRRVWDGTLPSIRLGRRVLVPRARLEAMLDPGAPEAGDSR
jgi:excisionase family DNA binding protein